MDQSFLRKFGVLIVFAIAGRIAFALLLYDVTPKASLDFKYSRREIMEKSRAYLAGMVKVG